MFSHHLLGRNLGLIFWVLHVTKGRHGKLRRGIRGRAASLGCCQVAGMGLYEMEGVARKHWASASCWAETGKISIISRTNARTHEHAGMLATHYPPVMVVLRCRMQERPPGRCGGIEGLGVLYELRQRLHVSPRRRIVRRECLDIDGRRRSCHPPVSIKQAVLKPVDDTFQPKPPISPSAAAAFRHLQ